MSLWEGVSLFILNYDKEKKNIDLINQSEAQI